MFSFSNKRKTTTGAESHVERLTNILVDNQDRLTIDRDGVISLNLENDKVRKEMKRQFHFLARVEPSKAR
ncbi:TPA: hypothetical protein MH658_16380 [Klebsiella pneumoniae]|nr:hypothetical protein [Klebsiella pneumoniae]HBX6350686.1 hypothetical protein [Klebsiella pneumoniae]